MVESVAEAFEALKPLEVVKADFTEDAYTRQGDIFAVETLYARSELRAMGAVFGRRSDALRVDTSVVEVPRSAELARERVRLLGTNHIATEVATLPDGRQYARGVLYHAPGLFERRGAPDHSRRKMGDGKAWHEIVRNTVPRSFDAPRAWSGFGRVD